MEKYPMNKCISFYFVIFSIGCLLISSRCSKNPFFEKKLSTLANAQIVTGQVQLNEESSPENVFVWLESINISTYTDKNGDFELQLPPPQGQPGGGLNGKYRLFYYIGNYKVKTSTVVIVNGEFVYGQGDIDANGNILKTVVMQKLIDIKTEIQPSTIQTFDTLRLEITVTLVPQGNSVKIEALKAPGGWLVGFFFHKINTPLSESILNPCSRSPVTEVIYYATHWKAGLRSDNLSLEVEPAEYEVIPYLRIIQDELPDELITSIAEKADRYHYNYLKIPFKQEVGHFTVTE